MPDKVFESRNFQEHVELNQELLKSLSIYDLRIEMKEESQTIQKLLIAASFNNDLNWIDPQVLSRFSTAYDEQIARLDKIANRKDALLELAKLKRVAEIYAGITLAIKKLQAEIKNPTTYQYIPAAEHEAYKAELAKTLNAIKWTAKPIFAQSKIVDANNVDHASILKDVTEALHLRITYPGNPSNRTLLNTNIKKLSSLKDSQPLRTLMKCLETISTMLKSFLNIAPKQIVAEDGKNISKEKSAKAGILKQQIKFFGREAKRKRADATEVQQERRMKKSR